MNLRPYLFWLIIGPMLFIGLVLMALSHFSVVGSWDAATKHKKSLDKEYEHLKQLSAKKTLRDAGGVFDTENPEQVAQLTSEYLNAPSWQRVLQAHVDQFRRQNDSIVEILGRRSAILREPVAPSDDRFGWYAAYEARSATAIKALIDAGRLVTADGRMPTLDVLRRDSQLRAGAGLYTKGDNLPEASEHPQLTTRLRIVELISSCIIPASAAPRVNPIVGGQPGPAAGARMTELRWGEPDAIAFTQVDDLRDVARGRPVTLSFTGTLPALMATWRALEAGKTDGPIIVVTSADLRRKDVYRDGERLGTAAETLTLRLDILVMEFTAPAPVAGVAQ